MMGTEFDPKHSEDIQIIGELNMAKIKISALEQALKEAERALREIQNGGFPPTGLAAEALAKIKEVER